MEPQYKITKPHELQERKEEEEAAIAREIKQAITDFAYEILAEAKLNEFLDENRDDLLIEGNNVEKILSLDREEFKNREIEVTDIRDRIISILQEIKYGSKAVITDFKIELTIWISPQYFRDEEEFENK